MGASPSSKVVPPLRFGRCSRRLAFRQVKGAASVARKRPPLVA